MDRFGRRAWSAGARHGLSRAGRGDTFARVVERGLTRRELVRGALGAALVVYLPRTGAQRRTPRPPSLPGIDFESIAGGREDVPEVAAGHDIQVLLRWGDPVLAGAPRFDPSHLSATAQRLQFGYNCDYVGYFPIPGLEGLAERGMLVVNHEYTNPELMFRGYDPLRPTLEQVDAQLAAHGMTVVAVERDASGRWLVNPEHALNRRYTGTSPMLLAGPVAGHERLRSPDSPDGRVALGTLGNCSAGRTPWGTVLSAEENFHLYFGNRSALRGSDDRRLVHARFGIPTGLSKWAFETVEPRFDLAVRPDEPFHFGWVVELDPFDPTWQPRKRTAMGRLHREAANSTVATGGQVVLYSGDDIVFEYVYKFVTSRPWVSDPARRRENRDLLDEGTLYVARFDHDGTGRWLPLRQGLPGIGPKEGFRSQADVLLNPLGAADALGATKMDRPEDIEISPVDGRVYIALTKNPLRGTEGYLPPDATNPRAENRAGHILELEELDGDHAGTAFRWRFFLVCGDPSDPSTHFAGFDPRLVSSIACPDNLAFDHAGNLWIATDGQPEALGINDGLYAVPVSGAERGRVRRFFSAVPGSEVTGHAFTPDDTTLFLAVQHPGEGSSIEAPSSNWPDGTSPPRPSVVAITASDGGPVGRSR